MKQFMQVCYALAICTAKLKIIYIFFILTIVNIVVFIDGIIVLIFRSMCRNRSFAINELNIRIVN